MTRGDQYREHSTLASILAVVAIAFVVVGTLWHGVSGDALQRLWQDLVDRPSGPMSFRFFFQPTMALIAAAHDGWRDAQLGRSPYFWTVITDPEKRASRLREGLVSTARIMLLGIGMDVIYQLTVLKTFYPTESVLIAIALAFVPYLLLRGPIERVARWWLNHSPKGRDG